MLTPFFFLCTTLLSCGMNPYDIAKITISPQQLEHWFNKLGVKSYFSSFFQDLTLISTENTQLLSQIRSLLNHQTINFIKPEADYQ